MNINNIDKFKGIYLHWSESEIICKKYGINDEYDINKKVDDQEFIDTCKKVGESFPKDEKFAYYKTKFAITFEDRSKIFIIGINNNPWTYDFTYA